MTLANYNAMDLDELRQYVLTHRADINAFQVYVDRSKAVGRMITINPDDPNWEENLEHRIQQATSGEAESS
jgi:hypothetical protein